MSRVIASIKGYESPVAGLIVGADCPVIMTSRDASAQEKYLSIAPAAACSGSEQNRL